MPYPLCQHIMTSGARCGSPAAHGKPYCHHHQSLRRLLPKRFVAWDSFQNDSVQGMRFIPMPLLEDALSVQTAYMQIIHGVLSAQMQLPAARVALAALRGAARNLPWVKAERAAMEGEQAELSQDVSEDREKVWSKTTYGTLRDTTEEPSVASPPPTSPSGAASAESSGQSAEVQAANPLPPRKQPDAVSEESGPQAQPGRAAPGTSG